MTLKSVPAGVPERRVKVQSKYETVAWKWMRYSGILLIPLVWLHVIMQDVIVGVHAIDLNYVQQRLAFIGWRIYDILLLGFAFAHGMNGLRQVLYDYIQKSSARKALDWILLAGWAIITLIGAVALIGGVRQP